MSPRLTTLIAIFAAMLSGLGVAVPAAEGASLQPPYINSLMADFPVEPTHFGSDYVDSRIEYEGIEYVRDIKWTSWGGKTATGVGSVSRLDGTTEVQNGYQVTVQPSRAPVAVTLSRIRTCAGIRVYTAYSLELLPGAEAPRHWPAGQSETFPCHVSAAHYQGFQTKGNPCLFQGLAMNLGGSGPSWQPKLPQTGADIQTVFCYMKWKHWGSVSTSAEGVRATLTYPHSRRRYWPATLELGDPIWCPNAAKFQPDGYFSPITYSSFRLTLYGEGAPTAGSRNRALEAVGDHSGQARVYWQRLHPSLDDCTF